MNVSCPLCRRQSTTKLGKRSTFRTIAHFRAFVSNIDLYDRVLYRCEGCGFQFIHPLYDEEELNGLYNQPGYNSSLEYSCPLTGYDDPNAHVLLKSWKQKFLAAGVQSWLEKYRTAHSTTPTLLDVGCGRGHNMVIFKELGFDVSAIDMSDIQVRYVRDRLGFEVRKMSLEALDGSEKFDCVLAVHVIEHVTCPHVFMESLLKVLKPDGLVVIETPLTMDWGLQEQRYSDIYHTFFFDHFTLTFLAALHGLAYKHSINVMWKHDADFVDMVMCFEADPALKESGMSDAHVRAFRSCHDRLQDDYLKYARYYLAKESEARSFRKMMAGARKYVRTHGTVATIKRTLQYVKDHYLNRLKD